MGFPSGSAVKNPPAMQEMGSESLGLEDPPENEMATHSSILFFFLILFFHLFLLVGG